MKLKLILSKLSVFAGVALSFSGCSETSSKGPNVLIANPISKTDTPTKTETLDLSYWFIIDGCSTESQKFNSKEEMCHGLRDRALNKSCALGLRQTHFKKVECAGEFSEIFAENPLQNGPSPIHCTGYVAGTDGRKEIDQTIQWNRKDYQKIVLSSFENLKNAGEYSLHLLPASEGDVAPAMRIYGWFVDNNKIHFAESSLDSPLFFSHKDSQLNGRDVSIECELMNTEKEKIKPVDPTQVFCLGSRGEIKANRESISASLKWDGQTPVTDSFKAYKDKNEITTNIKVSISLDPQSSATVIQITNPAQDGHVSMINKTVGRLNLTSEYKSAWDDRDIKVTCASADVWKRASEKKAKALNQKATNETK